MDKSNAIPKFQTRLYMDFDKQIQISYGRLKGHEQPKHSRKGKNGSPILPDIQPYHKVVLIKIVWNLMEIQTN